MAKISETGQPKTLAHRWTYDGDKVLVVRQCAHDGSSSHGFVWPKSGPVECPDWQPHNNCGNGLHGWPWGLAMGDGAEPNFTSLWLVVAVDPKDIIDVEDAHGKVKFKAGEVVFAGEWWKARELTEKGRNAWIAHFSDGKFSDGKSSATGHGSASSATGDGSASSATGDKSASSATGYGSASSATGDESASSATGYRSASSATGNRSASSATGNSSASSATGYSSASSATGDASVAVCTGTESTARAGEWGVIALAWWNKRANRAEMRCARVVDGKRGTLKPGVAYRLNGRGRFVEVKAKVADAA